MRFLVTEARELLTTDTGAPLLLTSEAHASKTVR